jgi:DNA-binding transcriptional ArsR family regulator
MLETFTALAEPNRLRIVELLRRGPQPVGAISERLRVRQPQVSKHLRTLHEAGLVEVRADAQRRLYGLRAERFRALDAWLADYRALWTERLDAMDDVIAELKRNEETPENRSHDHRKKR